jgi:hypothetical protein
MDDLRNEIRAAFEREQSAFPPAGSLRPAIVRSVAAQTRRAQPNFQWLAVAAAVMIAVLVVVGLMSSRLNNRGTVAHPKAVPSPVDDYGPPPAGIPLFYLGDPNHPGWYVGFDWTGTPRGTIKLQQGADPNSYLMQSPDGSMFVITPSAKGGAGQYLDRLGRPIADASTYLPLQMWADDSQHYCTLEQGRPGSWTLSMRTPGSSAATTHAVALDSANLRSGDIAIGFAACSAVHDTAVLVYNYFPRPPEMWVVRISDGKVVSHRLYDTTYSDLAVSRDASLAAVNSARSTGYLAGPTAPNTVVESTTNGATVANLDPTYGVLGFSSDDKFALVATSPYAAGVATHLAVVEVATGNVVWRYDGDQMLSGFAVEPTGAGFAVMLQLPRDQNAHPTVSLIFVSGDGQAHPVPGQFDHP